MCACVCVCVCVCVCTTGGKKVRKGSKADEEGGWEGKEGRKEIWRGIESEVKIV